MACDHVGDTYYYGFNLIRTRRGKPFETIKLSFGSISRKPVQHGEILLVRVSLWNSPDGAEILL